MVRLLFIIQVSHASEMRGVAITFRPVDRFPLRFKGAERVVSVIFHDIIVDMTALEATLGSGST